MFPIHDEPAEAIMPRMRALHLPAPGLAAGVDHALRGPSPFGRDMAPIAFLPDHSPRRGIVKRGIQTQMVRVVGIRQGTHNRQRVEYLDNMGPSLTFAAGRTVLSGTPRPSTSKCSL